MASFKDLPDTTTLKHLHSDMVVVLVEGPTDEQLLERMFPGVKADLRFEAVGGYGNMTERLATERSRNPKVVGLLDRDALMREKRWAELFETDNDNFARATRADGLYVLTRWEIENYLFDLAAVHRLFSAWKTPSPTEEALLDMMIKAALGELHVTAGWCTVGDCGLPQHTGPGSCEDAHSLPERITAWIEGHHPELLSEYSGRLAKVMAFDLGDTAGKRERLVALLRMVDGKRFTERLQRRWLCVNKDPSNQLADNVGQTQPRTDDLYRFVDDLRKSAQIGWASST